MPATTTHRTRTSGSLLVLVGLTVLWLAWAAFFLTAPDHNPSGRCEGLGFGCTPTPRDVAEFVGAVALAPLSVLVLVVTLVVRLVRMSRGSPRRAWDVLVGALLLAMGALWLVGALAGAI